MNQTGARRKRTAPERTGPIRNSILPHRATASTPPAAAPCEPRPASAAGEPPAGGLREALECGVQTAYTVIDEYMRRGYEAARGNRNDTNGSGPMNGNRPNNAGWQGAWSPGPAAMEQWFTAVKAWTDMLSAFVPGGFPGAGPGGWQQPWNMGGMAGPWSAPGAQGAPCPTPGGPPISVRVTSLRPAEVTACLIPGAEAMPLVAHVPHLKGLHISCEGGNVSVHLNVAADQKAGTYPGKIQAHGRDVGDLTVTISEPSSKFS